jgi:hypothetical protein
MQLLKTAVATAVLGLMTSAAFAENLTPPPGTNAPAAGSGNGGLVLYAYNGSASLTAYLGLNLDDFLIPAASPSGGRSIDFGVLSGWSVFGGAQDVKWSVSAADQTTDGTGGSHGKRVATTADEAASVSGNARNGAVNNATANLNTFATNFNGACPSTNPCTTTDPSSNAYAGKLGDQINDPIGGGVGVAFVNTTTLGDSMFFYLISATTAGATSQATVDQYGNASGFGLWTLSANGDLTWNQPGVSAVPLPAAAWLLLSGLAGFGVIGRRRSDADNQAAA